MFTSNNLYGNIKLLLYFFAKKPSKEKNMYDITMKIGKSTIQHGKQNDRIYLMDLNREDMPDILKTLDDMADRHSYSKIFTKIPRSFYQSFSKEGYQKEALVPAYYRGEEDCIFMSKYKDQERSIEASKELNNKVIETAKSKKPNELYQRLPQGFSFRLAKEEDASKIADIYSKVFSSYPFPILEYKYIQETIRDNVIYFMILKDNEIVALSACEMDFKNQSAEMTDFAILPNYRGHNFSAFLLAKMEEKMKENKIKTAYTIARAVSFGMNSSFAKSGYEFTGRLIKNTQIAGNIEDMNVWYKSL